MILEKGQYKLCRRWLDVTNCVIFYDNSGTAEDRTHNTVNELTARDATNLTYDDNGNLTDDGTFEYEYDALNRLIKVTRKSDSAVMGEYAYDALNRRMWREADENQDGIPDVDLMYFYDGNRVVEERDYSDQGLLKDYVYGVYIDEPIFGRSDNNDDNDFTDSEEQFYYCHNNLYNVAVLLDTSGDITESYEYLPYGKVTIYTDKGADCAWFTSDDVTGSLTGNYYLFTGRRYDPESGLYYFRRRYDSPTLGRFGQRDPTGYVDGMNLYTYVSDNPVNFTDAMGLRKGKGHFEVLIDSRTGKPEGRPLVRDVIISIGAAGAKRQASEGARMSLLAADTPGEVIVSFHSGVKQEQASEGGVKFDWLPPGTPGEVIVCWHAEKRGEGVIAAKAVKEKEKPKILYKIATGDIINWGYSDFSAQVESGVTKQVEVEPGKLPAEKLEYCRYNPDTGKIEKKSADEIKAIEDAEKLREDREQLIRKEIRKLAITSLKAQGLLPADYE